MFRLNGVKEIADKIQTATEGDVVDSQLGTNNIFVPTEGGLEDFNKGIKFGYSHRSSFIVEAVEEKRKNDEKYLLKEYIYNVKKWRDEFLEKINKELEEKTPKPVKRVSETKITDLGGGLKAGVHKPEEITGFPGVIDDTKMQQIWEMGEKPSKIYDIDKVLKFDTKEAFLDYFKNIFKNKEVFLHYSDPKVKVKLETNPELLQKTYDNFIIQLQNLILNDPSKIKSFEDYLTHISLF